MFEGVGIIILSIILGAYWLKKLMDFVQDMEDKDLEENKIEK